MMERKKKDITCLGGAPWMETPHQQTIREQAEEIKRLEKRQRLEDVVLRDAVAVLETLHVQPQGSYSQGVEEAVRAVVPKLRAAISEKQDG